MSIFHLSKKNERPGNRDIIGYWLVQADSYIEKDLELSPSPQIVQKIPEKCLP